MRYIHAPFQVFFYWSYRYTFHGHLIPSHIKRVMARWLQLWTCNLEDMRTFIRGNRCIEREKDNSKSREVKRLKDCALALNIELHFGGSYGALNPPQRWTSSDVRKMVGLKNKAVSVLNVLVQKTYWCIDWTNIL